MNIKLFMQALSDIKDEYILESADTDKIKENFKDWDEGIAEVPRKKIKHKKALMAAAIIAIILLAVSIASVAIDADTIYYLEEVREKILQMNEDETLEYKDATIVKRGGLEEYSTLEEFYEKTDFDILYPSKFPNGITFSFICVRDGSVGIDGKYTKEFNEIFFVLDSEYYSFDVSTNPNTQTDFLKYKGVRKETIGGYECYVIDLEKTHGCVECHLIYNGMTYYAKAPNYEDVVTIITNLKEYKG